MKIEYKLIRSKRKTLSISISKSLEVIVRAPLFVRKKEIDNFVLKHSNWIIKNITLMKERNKKSSKNELSEQQISELRNKAKQVIPKKVEYFCDILGVKAEGVKITSAKTRWGSCSYKNNICFTYRIMLLPDSLIDYVVVHELAHIKKKNHSPEFYAIIAGVFPNYKEMIKAIRDFEA